MEALPILILAINILIVYLMLYFKIDKIERKLDDMERNINDVQNWRNKLRKHGLLTRCCDNCAYYSWYYDKCDKWQCEVDSRSVCDDFTTHNDALPS